MKPILTNLFSLTHEDLAMEEYLTNFLQLQKGMLWLLCGTGSSGKTTLIQYLALCLTNRCNPFSRFNQENKYKVLHIDQEQSEKLTKKKYYRLSNGLYLDGEVNVSITKMPERITNNNLADFREALLKLLQGFDFVFIDSLKALCSFDENSAEIEKPLNILREVAELTNTCICVIHHKGKGNITAKQTGRGHSSIYDAVDMQVDLDYTPDNKTYTIRCAKPNRYTGHSFDPIYYRLSDEGDIISRINQTRCLKLIEESKDQVEGLKTEEQEVAVLEAVYDNPNYNKTFLSKFIGGDKGNTLTIINKLVEMGQLSLNKEKKQHLVNITNLGLKRINQYVLENANRLN